MVLSQAVRSAAPVQPSRPPMLTGWRDEFVALAGRVIVLGGFWSLVSLLLRPVRWIRWVDDLFGLVNLPAGPSLFSTVLLFVVGGAVRRRMRVSLWLLLGFQAVAALNLLGAALQLALDSDEVHRTRPVEVAELVVNLPLTVLLVVLLWRSRAAFTSRLEPGARWRALGILVAGLVVSVSVTIALTLSFPDSLTDVGHQLAWAVRVSFGVEPTSAEVGWQNQHGHHWIAALSGLLSALALVLAALVFLRSARAKAYLTAQDELEIRRLLLQAGERDSLGYFATRHDKSVIFAPGQSAAVTYRVLANVSLASADPIGPPAAWPAAITAWLAETRTFGWFPAVLSASEEGAQAYVAAGLKALPIGDEAIIDVDTFTLEGPTMQPVRQAVHRVQRAGYTISVRRHADLSAEQLAELARRAEDWRGEDTERGFSMALGRLGAPVDGGCVAVLASDADGRLRGLLSMVPWGRRGLSLDLMRRDRTAENGLVEAMVSALVTACRDELGVRRLSLNFAMFRGVFSAAERVGAGPVVRLTSRVLTFASRFWQIESLYRSNARYLPSWVPRYLCYDSSLTLTRVALAAGMAEGFLPAVEGSGERGSDGQVLLDGRRMPFAEAVALQSRAARSGTRPVRRLSQQQQVRHDKLARLVEAGRQPYPVSVPRTCEIAGLRERFAGLPPDTRTGELVSVAGRVRALRDFGGLTFATLQDGQATIQALVSRAELGPAEHRLLRSTLDLGDFLSVTGEVGTSRRGELSVLVTGWQMAAKCLRPLPDSHAGFADPEARARLRHVDLIVHPDALQLLTRRSVAVRELREAFARRGFLEVETPMLQPVHGGANARPFVTHINAYDATLYLRIAPELFLKRLCVAGMGRVFELNRNFRNEGADATHNPEFTSVEAYQAYADYLDMRELTQALICEVATAMHGSPVARRPGPDGTFVDVDLSGPWRSVPVYQAVSQACGVPVNPGTGRDELSRLCRAHGINHPADAGAGALVTELYEVLVEKHTTEPTFYLDFPVESSPLTRAHRSDPRLAERWDLVAFGTEIGTAYSELIDPVDQRQRLVEQSLAAADGDVEAMQVDEAFLSALEYAMPPTGGLGLGVDRLVMMLAGASIRQTLAFPFVRPGGR
ncbi:bifunctional lysylphosphatidylglycerol synthetase/lysine--tRNA ligase LysX [Jatrophihabitans sp.]|uniref:bifunctional lysylphosphatidylglycerol synthetase/lysine--tRNA ligase LysX n=1 Tax=Jatrophihabitans sp. TaxID=1932789 RepID=UPI002BDE9062|nr:bifunctional lysylphosphatidylglycerol synthetase/lysine--tRNA ligase LysX [Jatrophihabitans sp.]